MIETGLALLCPIILGFIVLHLLVPGENLLTVALLSIGVGFGISSWIVFLWLLVAGHASRGLLLAETVAILTGAALAYRRRTAGKILAQAEGKRPWRIVSLETALILGLVAVAAAAT